MGIDCIDGIDGIDSEWNMIKQDNFRAVFRMFTDVYTSYLTFLLFTLAVGVLIGQSSQSLAPDEVP